MNDHRRSSDEALAAALGRREALALAEMVSRTLPVAHAVARRMVATAEIEPLLVELYADLWERPITDGVLEAQIRHRCYALARERLHESGAAPVSPSVRTLEPDLPESSQSYLDTTERMLAALDEQDRRVLLRAHDQGVPAVEQDVEDAPERLIRALRALGQGEEDTEHPAWDRRLGDWVLGLVPIDDGQTLDQLVRREPDREPLVRALRRGRRRVEGLPPAPDLAPRLVAVVLSGIPAAPPATAGSSPPTRPPDVAPSGDPADHDTGEIPVTPGPGGPLVQPRQRSRDDALHLDDLLDDDEDEALASVLRGDLGDDEVDRAPAEPVAAVQADGEAQPREPETEPEGPGAPEEPTGDGEEQAAPETGAGRGEVRAQRGALRRVLRFVIGAVLLALGVGVGLFVGQLIAGAVG